MNAKLMHMKRHRFHFFFFFSSRSRGSTRELLKLIKQPKRHNTESFQSQVLSHAREVACEEGIKDVTKPLSTRQNLAHSGFVISCYIS